MRIPEALLSLADYGIIDEVLRPLMSGKEAQVYLVRSDGQLRVAKVYKEAQNRTFKNRAEYTEGRKVRNSRDQRAMSKGSRHGRAQVEAAWRTTEVDMIYRLRAAGVSVPTPYHFIDGVLVMEMITDEHGEPAPRLGDVVLEREAAQGVFDGLLGEVVRMLAAGVVHGDLSDFNVLMGPAGPVVIDFPQAVDASSNHSARKLLLRDVDNLHRFMERFVPERARLPYAQEMWALYERGELTPDTKLSGRYKPAERKVSTDAVLGLIGDANRDERRRREHLGLSTKGVADHDEQAAPESPKPLSRYQQKRQAQVAATLALKAAAAAAPAPRPVQRDPRANATHQQQRAPHGNSAARPQGSQDRRAHDARGHEARAHGSHEGRARASHEGRTQGSHDARAQAHGAGRAQGGHEGRAQSHGAGRGQSAHEGRSHGSREQQRVRHTNTATSGRTHGAREQQPRDAGQRGASSQAPQHARSEAQAAPASSSSSSSRSFNRSNSRGRGRQH